MPVLNGRQKNFNPNEPALAAQKPHNIATLKWFLRKNLVRFLVKVTSGLQNILKFQTPLLILRQNKSCEQKAKHSDYR